MPTETTPNRPQNADPETDGPDERVEPKEKNTLGGEVQPPNAAPEDQGGGSGTGPKADGTLGRDVEPRGNG